MSDNLRLDLVASRLAREIFIARNDVFEMDDAWQTLTPAQRAIFEKQALDIITANRPIRSKVIASISPEYPWGISNEHRSTR